MLAAAAAGELRDIISITNLRKQYENSSTKVCAGRLHISLSVVQRMHPCASGFRTAGCGLSDRQVVETPNPLSEDRKFTAMSHRFVAGYLLMFESLRLWVPRTGGAGGSLLGHPARPALRLPGPQRGGQDDDPEHPRRPPDRQQRRRPHRWRPRRQRGGQAPPRLLPAGEEAPILLSPLVNVQGSPACWRLQAK